MQILKNKFRPIVKVFILVGVIQLISCDESSNSPQWSEITQETKPWSRWWWHGSAVTREGITAEMEAYKQAGIGGLEITPIYGVYGYEENFIPYLSPEWIELLEHTLKEAERLDMGIDMATGTGWPFGGPWVTEEDACKNMYYRVYDVKEGERLTGKIEFRQQPFVRAVGNQIYEVHDEPQGEKVMGTRKEPLLRLDPQKIDIATLKDPIADNDDLQRLALDQVRFEKFLPLKLLMGYSTNGEIVNLTGKVDGSGQLQWVASNGDWKLYAVFEGWHGKMVERAAPGGEGNVIDHFSSRALENYLHQFDSALEGKNISSLRAFFNDSYEVDDARGSADWTPLLFDAFEEHMGYDLREHLPALFGQDEEEKNKRILCDYRETISWLLLDNFTKPWKAWANKKSALVRNQAHGSPANILDLYATVDIPEIEGTEPLRIKMASSSGNVTGKKLISSESATWLNEHFESNLSDIKVALDRFMLNGVNHVFYHGTSYSPPGEPWPGWLFYAAVHVNPRNPLWNDTRILNEYVARCQSLLQNSSADHEILLYYPVYDRFSTPGPEMIEHFDGIGRQFEGTPFAEAAEFMLENGYTFDYISDRQIENIVLENGNLKTEGGAQYMTLVLPHCEFIPLNTFRKISSLAEAGATIITYKGLPQSVAGYKKLDDNKKEFSRLMDSFTRNQLSQGSVTVMKTGNGRILNGDELDQLFSQATIRRESITDRGLQFDRKKRNNSTLYFIINKKSESIEGWIPLQAKGKQVVLYDPMDGRIGKAKTRQREDQTLEVFIRLMPEQAIFTEVYPSEIQSMDFDYRTPSGTTYELTGKWNVTFTEGGPELPESISTDTLSFWTSWEENEYQAFSGTAVYSLSFQRSQESASGWWIDLGVVKESAKVRINGKDIGTSIGPVHRLYFPDSILNENNTLEVHVSNLMANRITNMDKHGMFWKKFYNINFPARRAENRKNGLFSASHWEPRESGLKGSVKLIAVSPSD